eukprot:10404652-Ditylum_brightwellii.AAC.1
MVHCFKKDFQNKINKLAGSDYMQFTTKIWEPIMTSEEKVAYPKENKEDVDEWKKIQQLKCIDMECTHRPSTFSQITTGVQNSLGGLISREGELCNI